MSNEDILAELKKQTALLDKGDEIMIILEPYTSDPLTQKQWEKERK